MDPVVKTELVRWTTGLLKCLVQSEANTAFIVNTTIPASIVFYLQNSTKLPEDWATNSLEDFALYVLLNLAQWPSAETSLREVEAVAVIEPILIQHCVQGLKATVTLSLIHI